MHGIGIALYLGTLALAWRAVSAGPRSSPGSQIVNVVTLSLIPKVKPYTPYLVFDIEKVLVTSMGNSAEVNKSVGFRNNRLRTVLAKPS